MKKSRNLLIWVFAMLRWVVFLVLLFCDFVVFAQSSPIPVAYEPDSFERAGTGIGFIKTAGGLINNPAGIKFIQEDDADLFPFFFAADIEHMGRYNPIVHSEEDIRYFINLAAVSDFQTSYLENLRHAKYSRRRPSINLLATNIIDTSSSRFVKHPATYYLTLPVKTRKLPKTIKLKVRGKGGREDERRLCIENIAVFAKYVIDGITYTRMIGSVGTSTLIRGEEFVTAANFVNISELMPANPVEIEICFYLKMAFQTPEDYVEVKAYFDEFDVAAGRYLPDNIALGTIKEQIWRISRPVELPPEAFKPSRVKYGIGIYTLSNFFTDYELSSRTFGQTTTTGERRFVKYASDYSFFAISPAIAYQINDFITVGGCIFLGISGFDPRMPVSQNLISPSLPAGVQLRDMNVESEASGFRAKFGLLLKINKDITAGFTFASPGFIDEYEGDANITTATITYPPNAPSVIQSETSGKYDASVKNFMLPAEIGLGICYRVHPKVSLFFDYRYEMWEEAVDEIELEFRNGPAAMWAQSFTVKLPFNWDNKHIFAIGGDVSITDYVNLRGGLYYSPQHIPSDNLISNFPFINEFFISFGISAVYENFVFDLGYMHGFEDSQRIGDSVFNPDFDGTKIESYCDLIIFGLVYRY